MALIHHNNISSLCNRSTVHPSLSPPKQRPVRPVPQLRRFHSLLRDRPETSHLDLSGSWISPRCRGSAAESRWRPVIVGAAWMNRNMSIKWEPYLETCGGNLFPLLGCQECFTYIQFTHIVWFWWAYFKLVELAHFRLGELEECIQLFTFTVSGSSHSLYPALQSWQLAQLYQLPMCHFQNSGYNP